MSMASMILSMLRQAKAVHDDLTSVTLQLKLERSSMLFAKGIPS